MADLPYDPDLKEAMLKIEAILDEYKIGGNIVLASRTNSEFLYHFPKWSIAQFNENKDGIDFKLKKGDQETQEEKNKDIQDSVAIIFAIRDISFQTFEIFSRLTENLRGVMDIDHNPFHGFNPHFEN